MLPREKLPLGLEILYEDDALVALNKPAGVLTARDRWDAKRQNVMDALHAGVRNGAAWAANRSWSYLANAHRLDLGTSGVLLLAKSREALGFLLRQFKNRTVTKLYSAIVVGVPSEAELLIERRIGPKPGSPGLSAVGVRVSSHAETLVRVRERLGGHTLVEAEPRTGRLHQIRVHLQSIGCPVAADPDYGNGKPLLLSELKQGYKKSGAGEKPLLARPALHARAIRLVTPSTGQQVVIEAPLPKDFELALKYLRKFGR